MNILGAISSLQPPGLAALRDAAATAANSAGGISPSQVEKLGGSPITGFVSPTEAAPGSDFSSVLGQMVREVQAKQAQASTAMTGVLAGDGVPLHEAVLAAEEASVAFQLMVEVRNKLLESYQELMRMQV